MRTRIALIALIALVACPKPPTPPEQVNFNTDPRIFRGVWTGMVTDYPQTGQTNPVKLDLEPEQIYPGSPYDTYQFSGTITLGNNAPLVLVGTAFGNGSQQYVRPQTSLPPPPGGNASVYNAQGRKIWELYCYAYRANLGYTCQLLTPNSTQQPYGFTIQQKP
jgi:hypothetical protein